MASCCEPDPDGYRDMFTARRARRSAQRFRRSGLDRDSRRIVDFLETLGIQGASVLDIGGGVGPLHLELLRRGASRATSIEFVDSYDAEADALARELGLAGQVTPLHGKDADLVSRHDVVAMHRVVPADDCSPGCATTDWRGTSPASARTPRPCPSDTARPSPAGGSRS